MRGSAADAGARRNEIAARAELSITGGTLIVMKIPITFLLVVAGVVSVSPAATHEADVARLGVDGAGWEVVERPGFAPQRDADGKTVAVQSNPSVVAYVRDVTFGEGTIEFTLRGRAGDGSSFVGVVFHGVDGTTYDGVYFRAFNFGHENPVKRRHAVQYIAHPDWPWFRLRKERTDEFEKGITPEPKPDEWFRARVVVSGGRVRAYVNDATEPSLDVPKLNDRTSGKVGIMISGYGDIAALKITPRS